MGIEPSNTVLFDEWALLLRIPEHLQLASQVIHSLEKGGGGRSSEAIV